MRNEEDIRPYCEGGKRRTDVRGNTWGATDPYPLWFRRNDEGMLVLKEWDGMITNTHLYDDNPDWVPTCPVETCREYDTHHHIDAMDDPSEAFLCDGKPLVRNGCADLKTCCHLGDLVQYVPKGTGN